MSGREADELDELERRLADALGIGDPVPAEAVENAKQLLPLGALGSLDQVVAELVQDSLAGAGVAMRGSGPLSLSFATDDLAIELDVDSEHGLVLGQLAPAAAATVTLESDDVDVAQTTTDDLGRFRLEGLDPETRSALVRVTVAGSTAICAFDLGA